MTHANIPNSDNTPRTILSRIYGKIAPSRFQRHFVQNFITPKRSLRSWRARHDLRPADEPLRIPVGGGIGLISDSWVQAWRWGEGPAVLLVHGWEDDHHSFDAIIAALIENGHAVVAFDLPAHGKSGGTQCTVPLAAQAMQGVAEALGPVRAVVGHSFGAAAAAFAITQGWIDVERVVAIAAPGGSADALNAIAERLDISDERKENLFEELKRVVGYRPEEIDLLSRVPNPDFPALIVHSMDDATVLLASGEESAARQISDLLVQQSDFAPRMAA